MGRRLFRNDINKLYILMHNRTDLRNPIRPCRPRQWLIYFTPLDCYLPVCNDYISNNNNNSFYEPKTIHMAVSKQHRVIPIKIQSTIRGHRGWIILSLTSCSSVTYPVNFYFWTDEHERVPFWITKKHTSYVY